MLAAERNAVVETWNLRTQTNAVGTQRLSCHDNWCQSYRQRICNSLRLILLHFLSFFFAESSGR